MGIDQQWNTTGERLWQEYRVSPTPQLREQLVEHYRSLARATVRRLCHFCDEDLEQVAMVALVKAVDRFDPARDNAFSTYAVPTILGEVRHYLRDQGRLIRYPRALQELRERVRVRERELIQANGQVPTLGEVAASLGVDLDQIVEALAAEERCHPLSLNAPVGASEDGKPQAMDEWIGERDRRLECVEAEVAWGQVLEQLGPQLKQVIQLRYFQQLSQQEVGQRMGCSQMHISRLERRALARLRPSVPIR
jgi:RNA polymerase sigma-B factor